MASMGFSQLQLLSPPTSKSIRMLRNALPSPSSSYAYPCSSSGQSNPLLATSFVLPMAPAGNNRRAKNHIVRMAPDYEPLNYPVEWETPILARKSRVLKRLNPIEVPLPPPLPFDPPEDDEEWEEGEWEEEEYPYNEEEEEEPEYI